MIYLPDTNVVSQMIAERASNKVLPWLSATRREDAFLSAIALGELEYGVRRVSPGAARALIAATALVRNLTVVTRSEKDFAALGARVLNPWS